MRSLVLLAAHVAGDFPLQSDRMVAEKFTSPIVRAGHVSTYSLPFIAATTILGWTRRTRLVFLAGNWLTHYAIDTRRWAEPREGFEARPLWFDQAYHVIALALLAFSADLLDETRQGGEHERR